VDPSLAESEARSMRPKHRDLTKVNARLERGVGSDPNELIFVKMHEGQGVRYKLRPEGKRGGASSQRVQGQLRSSKTQ
jgi:hypothetical protein